MKKDRSKIPCIRIEYFPRGVKWCLENAERLLGDAQILNRNKRYSSAIVLSVFSWEEIGKATILRQYWSKKKVVTEKEWYDVIRNHVAKAKETRLTIEDDLAFHFKKDNPNLKILFDEFIQSEAVNMSVKLKEHYLYVNWSWRGWSSPERLTIPKPKKEIDYANKILAERLIKKTEQAISIFKSNSETQQILQAVTPDFTAETIFDTIVKIIDNSNIQQTDISVKLSLGFDISEIVIDQTKKRFINNEQLFLKLKSTFPNLKKLTFDS